MPLVSVLKVRKALQAQLVRKAQLGRRAQQVRLGLLVHKVQLALQAHRDLLVHKVRKVSKVLLALTVQRALSGVVLTLAERPTL